MAGLRWLSRREAVRRLAIAQHRLELAEAEIATHRLCSVAERAVAVGFVSTWLEGRANAYRLDADHQPASGRKSAELTDVARRVIAAELEFCARDLKARKPS